MEPSEGSDALDRSDPVGDLFHELDEGGSGELDIDEVRKLCKRLGQKLDNAAVSRAFREMDADASGAVDLKVGCASLERLLALLRHVCPR